MSTPTAEQLDAIEGKLNELLAHMGTPPQRWLKVRQAAAYTGMGEESIRRSISSGQLTAHRPRKGLILLDVRQIDSWVQGATSRPRNGRGFHLHTV